MTLRKAVGETGLGELKSEPLIRSSVMEQRRRNLPFEGPHPLHLHVQDRGYLGWGGIGRRGMKPLDDIIQGGTRSKVLRVTH